jgi:hypothetical protein
MVLRAIPLNPFVPDSTQYVLFVNEKGRFMSFVEFLLPPRL